MSTDKIKAGDRVRVRDVFGWHETTATTSVEGTRHPNGRKWHGFPVIWVKGWRSGGLIPWPAEDVEKITEEDARG